MDWNTCITEGNALKIAANRKRAAFLIRQAKNTLAVLGKIKLDEENASVFFVNYYDALLEMTHALMYAKGFKVKNHYCLGYYLRDVANDRMSYRTFDRARLLRHSLLYYGERFDSKVLLDAIEQIKELCNKLEKEAK